MKLLRYSFTAHHVPGVKMKDADALSRAPHSQPTKEDLAMVDEISCHVNEVIKQMPSTTPYLQKVKNATEKDDVLQKFKSVMQTGWPKSKQLCPESVKSFWDS